MQLYNTLTRKKEIFTPLNPPKVTLYVCGVTVYDDCHLGHARALVNFDVLARYLRYKKYEVQFVRNFTDVDDKIIARAEKDGVAWNFISETYIDHFHRDIQKLGNITPSIEPKATEHIPEMITMIQSLMDQGYAYAAGGDVIYSVRKKTDYGKLSGKKIDELESGARIEIHESKKDPLDFVLWKASKPGEPFWESPWGKGRPGWHIECSAMSTKYLGDTLDIHGGGRDLSFPHHENEIAQSEAATGQTFARYWVHNGFVNINAQKMSKSLGNFLKLADLFNQYPPEVIRLFILAAHYRSPLDYTETTMEATRQSLLRWYGTLARLQQTPAEHSKSEGKNLLEDFEQKIQGLQASFEEAMDDDLNTAKVVGILFDLARDLNRLLDAHLILPSNLLSLLQKNIQNIHSVLGIFGSDAVQFLEQEQKKALSQSTMKTEEIEVLLQERKEARASKNWARADEIRKELLAKNIEIKDHPDGSTAWLFIK